MRKLPIFPSEFVPSPQESRAESNERAQQDQRNKHDEQGALEVSQTRVGQARERTEDTRGSASCSAHDRKSHVPRTCGELTSYRGSRVFSCSRQQQWVEHQPDGTRAESVSSTSQAHSACCVERSSSGIAKRCRDERNARTGATGSDVEDLEVCDQTDSRTDREVHPDPDSVDEDDPLSGGPRDRLGPYHRVALCG